MRKQQEAGEPSGTTRVPPEKGRGSTPGRPEKPRGMDADQKRLSKKPVRPHRDQSRKEGGASSEEEDQIRLEGKISKGIRNGDASFSVEVVGLGTNRTVWGEKTNQAVRQTHRLQSQRKSRLYPPALGRENPAVKPLELCARAGGSRWSRYWPKETKFGPPGGNVHPPWSGPGPPKNSKGLPCSVQSLQHRKNKTDRGRVRAREKRAGCPLDPKRPWVARAWSKNRRPWPGDTKRAPPFEFKPVVD